MAAGSLFSVETGSWQDWGSALTPPRVCPLMQMGYTAKSTVSPETCVLAGVEASRGAMPSQLPAMPRITNQGPVGWAVQLSPPEASKMVRTGY